MKPMRFFTVLFIVFAVTTGVCAQEKKWSDQAELSFVDTGGNTDVTSLSAKNLLKYEFSDELLAEWKLGALYGICIKLKFSLRYIYLILYGILKLMVLKYRFLIFLETKCFFYAIR